MSKRSNSTNVDANDPLLNWSSCASPVSDCSDSSDLSPPPRLSKRRRLTNSPRNPSSRRTLQLQPDHQTPFSQSPSQLQTPTAVAAASSRPRTGRRALEGVVRRHLPPPTDGSTVRQRHAGGRPANPEPGSNDLPTSTWSLTVSATQSRDVPPGWFGSLKAWMDRHCSKAVLAIERGERQGNLHFQGAFVTKFGTAKPDCRRLSAHVKAHTALATGSKITLKPLQPGQTFEAMLGYCQKDAGLHQNSYSN